MTAWGDALDAQSLNEMAGRDAISSEVDDFWTLPTERLAVFPCVVCFSAKSWWKLPQKCCEENMPLATACSHILPPAFLLTCLPLKRQESAASTLQMWKATEVSQQNMLVMKADRCKHIYPPY